MTRWRGAVAVIVGGTVAAAPGAGAFVGVAGAARAPTIQPYCVYALYHGGASGDPLTVPSVPRAAFARLDSRAAQLAASVRDDAATDVVTAATAQQLAVRAHVERLEGSLETVAVDATSLDALATRLELALGAYASHPSAAARSTAVGLEGRYLSAADAPGLASALSDVPVATDGLCRSFDRAATEAESVVDAAVAAAQGRAPSAAQLRAALAPPPSPKDAVLSAAPASHVSTATLRMRGQRVCFQIGGRPTRALVVPCP